MKRMVMHCGAAAILLLLAPCNLPAQAGSQRGHADTLLEEWVRIHPDDPTAPLGGYVVNPRYASDGSATAVSAFGYLYHRDGPTAVWEREAVIDGSKTLFVEQFARSANNDDFFYADVRNRGVMVRRGLNEPWVDSLSVGSLIRVLEVAPSTEQVAYASRIATTYRTTDGGVSWSTVDAMEGSLRDVAISPADPSTLLFVLNFELWRSTDGGDTAVSVQPAALMDTGQVRKVAFNPVDPDIAVAISNRGSFRSTDGGQNWQPLSSEPWLGQYIANDVVFDPVAPDTMYIVASDGGSNVYRSSDGGASWQTIADALAEQSIISFAVSKTGEQLLGTLTGSYTATPGQPFVATNAGWSDVGLDTVAFDPIFPDAVYASSQFSGFVARGPFDAAWRLGNAGLIGTDVRDVWSSPTLPATLLLATSDTLHRSFDGGRSWAPVSVIDPAGRVRRFEVSDDGQLLFAIRSRSDLLRSEFAGQLWDPVIDGSLLDGRDAYPVLIAPRMDGTVYAGTQQSGTLKSADFGQTWDALEAPFGTDAATALRADPFNPDGLYVLVDARELWYSPDSGVTWASLRADGLPTSLVMDMAIDPFEPGRVYLAFDNRSLLYEREPASGNWIARSAPRGIECRGVESCRFYPVPNVRGRVLLTTSGELFSLQRDSDSDAVGDDLDNCVEAANVAQRDSDGDGFGNACDADIAPAVNDCVVNVQDLARFRAAFGSVPGDANWNPDADFDGDDQVNVIDLGRLRALFFRAPGPSSQASCAAS